MFLKSWIHIGLIGIRGRYCSRIIFVNHTLLQRNRLHHVEDYNLISNDIGEITDQGLFDQDPADINVWNNYIYDELGQLIADNQEEIDEIVWRVDGKISRVVREAASLRKSLEFVYDAMGNRVAKKVYSDNTFSLGSLEIINYYLRDASGNVMSIYEETTGQLNLTEQHIFGSSRLGMRTLRIDMLTAPTPVHTGLKEIIRGERRYELTNHLGNVFVVCSDQLTATDGDSNNFIDFYAPEVVSYSDYYPFGSEMIARSSAEDYRYNFQNQEKDNELWGGAITFKYRVEDARLGRFFSVDPLYIKFPFYSTYQFASNSVIMAVELEGLESSEAGTNSTENVPPENQEEFDRRYSGAFEDKSAEAFMSKIRDFVDEHNILPLDHATFISLMSDLAVEETLVLFDSDGTSHQFRVVNFESFELDPTLQTPENPEGEIPGSRMQTNIVDPSDVSDDPIFQAPSSESLVPSVSPDEQEPGDPWVPEMPHVPTSDIPKNSRTLYFRGTVEIPTSDPTDTRTIYRHYGVLFNFQLITNL